MSRIAQQPAARSLFSTLLATRPQRAPRITLADAAVATVVHLAALGFLVGVNRNNEMPGFAEEPGVGLREGAAIAEEQSAREPRVSTLQAGGEGRGGV